MLPKLRRCIFSAIYLKPGWATMTPQNWLRRFRTSLGELSQSGVKLYIQHGNRDFLIGQRFIQRCGAELFDDEHLVHYQGQTALVMHGDSSVY